MSVAESVRTDLGPVGGFPSLPGALLDVLNLAAVVLDTDGKIIWWSPQAEQLFGYTAEEALGRAARRLLVDGKHLEQVTGLFARVRAQEGAAGVFPARHKDGSTRLMECHSVQLQGERGDHCRLGVITEHEILQRVQRDLALSAQLIAQSPIGLAVLDTDLRYIVVNPALERINGVPARDHVGRTVRQVLTFLDADPIESAMRQVLTTGTPVLAQVVVTPTPSDPGRDHSWSASYYRMEDAAGRVLGLAVSLVDITEQHLAATEAIAARQRLARIADASACIGTTLDLDTTAGELAEMCVPALADLAAVDVLDAVLEGKGPSEVLSGGGDLLFRALAVAAAYPTPATGAADRAGQIARYGPDRLVTQCAASGRPLLVPHVDSADLGRIAADQSAATVLARAGVHSYLAVPMIVRGRVLGVLDLARARNPVPFNGDDVLLAVELAARAAVCIDHALWYQQQRQTAETLQRSLLPLRPPHRPGLEIACRYRAAGAAYEVGGDWYDVVPLPGGKTALVIGDVMGSGIDAAATMGQLRTATRTLATLDLDPAALLQHLDRTTSDLDHRFATCVYAVHDPHQSRCHLSSAGHLPPVLIRRDRAPALLDLPTGAPLGVGGVPFRSTCIALSPGDRLALYTDGLVEVRDQALDTRLEALLDRLAGPQPPLEDTCDLLLDALHHPDSHDDVALLIARVRQACPQ
ncbi:SpoIIE family protein phosphatase [Streptomyces sp. NPDC058451]|uniref:SpoIIE family protein phosphatase n=1 Tax=unclassified Streptomyces TaxID=2593676 RepID=UPI00364BC78D